MNKGKYTMFILSGLLAMACNKELVPEQGNDNNSSMVPMEIVAEISETPVNPDTKSAVDLLTGKTTWVSGDKLSVFDAPINSASLTNQSEFTTTDNGAVASFTGTFPAQNSGNICAIYPADAKAAIYNGKITTTLPHGQNAIPDGVDTKAVIMGADATVEELNQSKLSFKNICGMISFTLSASSENVRSVTLLGNNKEALTGSPQVDLHNTKTKYTSTRNDEACYYAVLRKNDYTALETGKKYAFVILPTTFVNGFSLVFTFMDGTQKIAKVSLKEGVTYEVKRNQISYIGEIDAALLTTVYQNDFILWESGCDIKVGTKSFNIHTGDFANKKGTLVTKENEIGSLKNKKVYFVEPDANAVLGGSAFTQIMVVGTDPNQKSSLTKEGQFSVSDNAQIALKSINYKHTGTPANLISLNKKATQPLKYIVFDHCKFDVPADYSLLYVANNASLKEFVMTNSDCALHELVTAGKSSCIFTSPSTVSSTIVFKNNLFYSEKDLKDFKLANLQNNTIDNLVIENNSFINTYFTYTGYVYAAKVTQFAVNSNIMELPKYGTYTVNNKGAQQYWGMINAGKAFANYPVEGKAAAEFNFSYREATTGMKTLKLTYFDLKNGDIYFTGVKNPESLKALPYTQKDFVNGVFTRSSERPKAGAQR